MCWLIISLLELGAMKQWNNCLYTLIMHSNICLFNNYIGMENVCGTIRTNEFQKVGQSGCNP